MRLLRAVRGERRRPPAFRHGWVWIFGGRYIRGNRVKLLRTGDEVFPRLEAMIDAARHHIHIECYIYREDAVGRRIAEKLKDAARRGVVVHLHLDALGCLGLTKRFARELQAAGVRVQFFHPIMDAVLRFSSLSFRRRLHRKAFVVDSRMAIVGGINIGQEYASAPNKPAWLDFGVYVEGPAAYHVNKIVEKTWSKEGGKYFYRRGGLDAVRHAGSVDVAVVRNFWITGLYDIHVSYIAAIRRARRDLLIANAYFLPGFRERAILREAVKRGVRVRVLLPASSDVLLMRFASRSLYRFFFQTGIEVYEWLPSMMHAKVAVIDGTWATVGSHNMDYISKFFNLEMNVNIRDASFAGGLEAALEECLSQSVRVVPERWERSRYFWYRLLDWLAFQVVALYSGFGGKVIRRASKRTSRSR